MEIVLLVALGGLLLFFMLNTRKRQKTQQEKLSNNLREGATVMTSFGMFGTVTDVDDDGIKVTVETTPGTSVVIHRQTIAQIEAPQDEEPVAGAGATTETTTEADLVAETPDAHTSDADKTDADKTDTDKAPRITDAELDAMNEAKRNAKNTNAKDNDPADKNDSDKK
ncbi:preprotein translocase subunit YajC [Brevibacterium paucivorans]|uniref:preprotein translocase subunit YajC n=1 Tax=Brevibacterium paucivorans TaxID=170994 RepID=UPI0015E0AC0D|nr:preprotein translocase subunit YajC [Brevibacterium paucivorans]